MAILKMSHRDKTPKPARHPEAPPAASNAHHQCPEPGNTSNPDAGLGHDPREVVLVRRRMREHKTRDVSHSSTGHAIEGPVRSHASSSTATQIAQNSLFERFSRAGYVVSGLLHLTIGYLAIRIALGVGGGIADQSGALAALAATPYGIVALWAAVVAFLMMGLWRLVETALGRSTDPKSQGASAEVLDRAKAFALAVVYLAFAYSAFGFARGPESPPVSRIRISVHV